MPTTSKWAGLPIQVTHNLQALFEVAVVSELATNLIKAMFKKAIKTTHSSSCHG
jgi:hypothetical protein